MPRVISQLRASVDHPDQAVMPAVQSSVHKEWYTANDNFTTIDLPQYSYAAFKASTDGSLYHVYRTVGVV